ncbi:MAG: hypothetical protein P9M07_07495 [Candidatus Aceula meridiana]|nr:hypothetical protein [Candidatus Aceula meridiana]
MFLFGGKKEQPISDQLEIDLIMSVCRAVDKTTLKMLEIKLEEKPKVDQHATVQWQGKTKISRPSDCRYVSGVVIPREEQNDNGMVIFYIPDSIAELISGALGAGHKEEAINQSCAEFLKGTVEYFKNHLVKLGYEELKVSEPLTLGKDSLIDYHRSSKYQLIFYRKGEKFVQIDLGIGPLQKVQ